MSMLDWILASGLVLLWLYAWSLSHSVSVRLHQRDEEWKARWLDNKNLVDSLFRADVAMWADLAKKQDAPLLRRKTDKRPK